MAKLGGTKRSTSTTWNSTSTQAIWLIWWFVFLSDVYILWVFICLLCYTLILICIFMYVHIWWVVSSQVVLEAPLEMFLVGVLPCQKGRLDGMGLFIVRNIMSWYIFVICMIELIEPIVLSMFRFMWFIVNSDLSMFICLVYLLIMFVYFSFSHTFFSLTQRSLCCLFD